MKKLRECDAPKDIDAWMEEVSDVAIMPLVDEIPQAPLVLDEITPSRGTEGLYSHNSFKTLHIGDVADIDGNLAHQFITGKLKIEARLDLHGLTEAQAFERVKDFIRQSSDMGRRCVLIITGKGNSSEVWWENKGVIRQSFAGWLNNPEIRPYLLSVAQATPRDGGSGAFYCLLKRRRFSSNKADKK